ncbi:cysteine dioxygenase type I [Stenotrophomonas phage StenR_269]|nr:cysteine dioxygenase type I [Stenotrophomonas phage StenR_269]
MLQLLMHHVGRTDLTGIRNCHIPGLHSIMLHDQEGNRVRLYVTQNIDTHANYVRTNQSMIDEDSDFDDEQELELERASTHRNMNLGFHGHRTEVRLHALTGILHNITAQVEQLDDTNEFRGYLRCYNYVSPIVDPANSGIFIQDGRYRVVDTEIKELIQDQYVILPPTTLHTVHCDNNTSWLVYERGASSEEEVSTFFSYNPHVLPPSSEMYQPMSSDECAVLIARVIALYNQEQQAAIAHAQAEARQEKADAALAEIQEAMLEGAATIVPSRIASTAQLRLYQKAIGFNKSFVMQSVHGAITDLMYVNWCEFVNRPGRRVSDPEFAAAFFGAKMAHLIRLSPALMESPVAETPSTLQTYEQLLESQRVATADRARRRAQEAMASMASMATAYNTWGSADDVAQGFVSNVPRPT